MGEELTETDAPVPTGYVYLEDYNEPDWLYIVDYDEPSTLEVFVYTPPLNELREAFNSGTQGKPGSQGLLLTAPVEVYDFFNTYQDGVGLKPAENYNANTELKIYYEDGVGQPGYKLGMFHVAQDISRQVDFMTGQIREPRQIYEETKTDSSGNIVKVYTFHPVDVTLKHRLCNIEVKAKNSNKDYDVDVAGVMLGRPMVYGPMFNFSTDEWEFPPLTRQDLYNPATYAYAPADAKNPVGDYIHRLGDDAVSLMGNGGNALVLPTELGAWDYHDPDNSDAYSFNNEDRPIMFLAALVRVLPKNAIVLPSPLSITDMMYPFGKPSDDYEWDYNSNIDGIEGGAWVFYGNWYYDSRYDGWCYDDYYGDEFSTTDSGVCKTEEDTGWICNPITGLWSYNKNVDKGVHEEEYSWLLNWRIEKGYWYYIGKETGAEWEMLTDEDGNPITDEYEYPYWKYKGDYVFNPETEKWEIPEKIIFPSKYLIDNSNFETQEFGVLKNGYPGDVTKPGSTLKPDYVLGMSYNDRDKSAFTDKEKAELKSKNNKVEFQTYAWVGFPVAVDWKQGHKYTYTLDFTNGLGVELPNGIYGARLISDIVKAFEEYEKTGKPIHDLDLPNPEIPQMVKSANLPQGWGSIEVESSVWEPDDIVIKK